MTNARSRRAAAFTGRLRPWIRLPEDIAPQQVLASTVDHRGRLIALLADDVTRGSVDRPYAARVVAIEPSGDLAGADWSLHSVEVDGRGHTLEVEPLDFAWPMIDALSDGFVVANARNRQLDAPNLRVIDSTGSTRTAFAVGDAIEHLLVDSSDNIWIGYFDESELLIPGTRQNVAPAGLARWRPDGELSWLQGNEGLFWLDCYALNVGRHLTWACPYTDFPLVTLDRTGVRTITPTSVQGARGLLVVGNTVAFLGSYADSRYINHQPQPGGRFTIPLAHPDEDQLTVLRTVSLTLPDGTEPPTRPHQLICRDHRAYFRFADPREWFLLEL